MPINDLFNREAYQLVYIPIMSNPYQSIFDRQKSKSLLQRSESVQFRRSRLQSLKAWVLNNKDRIRKAIFEDLRKSETDTDISEIFTVTTEINEALRKLNSWSRPRKVSSGLTYLGTSAFIKSEPKGVCLIVAPWNFPFNLIGGPLVSCLAAGNTAILKPSEHTPATAQLIMEMTSELFAEEEVTAILGGVEETTSLLDLPFDHIFFTGSTEVGKIVMTAAAKHLTSVTLELGGKSPVIIEETADVADAAKKIVWGKFINNGQTCIAPDYILVHESLKEQLIDSIRQQVSNIFDSRNIGITNSEDYSRMVNRRQAERVIGLLEESLENGAVLEIGGKSMVESNFIEPTLISNVKSSDRIWKEEIFGPILPLQTFIGLEEVIEHINAHDKPLALYLFSKSKKVKRKVTNETSAGSMVINDVVIQYAHPNLPFGGVNHSGMGKSHGRFGFESFSNQKSLIKQRIGLTNAWFFYPPFNSFKRWVVGFLIKHF